ncbi:OPT family oligopeptide transporter [uncultured Finegoldia sp.]|uniref:OPT family oligopeptide transporter n=1 Tax=uncultured Finegoldia sp. TaxID=328009 RepID=UPI002606A185|nr:oligopeptide transporter, OPT family [uncultured Finegoldia sp.]
MKNNNDFKPFISADKVVPELTPFSIVFGIIMAIIFGGANAYLGLRVGLTVSASIPAAVISMGFIRLIFKRDSILENNIVQTIGSAGESVAAGAIFTMPALFIWMKEWKQPAPSLLEIGVITLIGGLLGVLFMVPLRNALIVKEHGIIPYPEGTACAEVLLAGEEGGAKAKLVFKGLGLAALYKFVADGLKIFPSSLSKEITTKSFSGAGIGIDPLPSLVGVGYICGPKISGYMLSGATLGWLVIMPLMKLFGGDNIIGSSTVAISQMSVGKIWGTYLRYIGAGAVATGGILSLIKSLPLIIRTFKDAMKDYKSQGIGSNSLLRTEKDLSMKLIGISIIAIAIVMAVFPVVPVGPIGSIIIVVFGFFFATVSSRLVGLIGSSNNPVSGMTIAALLITSLLIKATGNTGHEGMMMAISIGTVICVIAAISGDTSQDLKTGYLVGATPYRQQIGEIIGVVVSAVVIGSILWLLDSSWGYGSKELPAPQGMLMKLIIEGVMGGSLPWGLVFAGAFIAVVVEILGIPVLPFAVGLYLPINTSAAIMTGGLIRLFVDKRKLKNEQDRKEQEENGVLFTSGFIAGEGVVGILLAAFAIVKIGGKPISEIIDISSKFSIGEIGSLVVFVLLLASLLFTCIKKHDEKK